MGSEDASLLVSYGDSVRIFSLFGEERVFPAGLKSNNQRATAARWFPNGKLLAVSTQEGHIDFRHHTKLNTIGQFHSSQENVQASRITCIDISSGSRFLAAGTEGGHLNIWDIKFNNIVNRFSTDGAIRDISFQQVGDSRYIACACKGDILLYSRASGRLVESFTVSSSSKTGAFEDSDSDKLVQGKAGSFSSVNVTALSFSPHNLNLLAVTDDNGCLTVWDVSRTYSSRSGSAVKSGKIDGHSSYSRFSSPFKTPATALSFLPPSSSAGLCVAGLDKNVRFYDRELKRCLFSVTCFAPISSISCSSDGTHLAVGMTDGYISTYKVDCDNQKVHLTSSFRAHGNTSSELSGVSAPRIHLLQFQPSISKQNDGLEALTPRIFNVKHTKDASGSGSFFSPGPRDKWTNGALERSNTTPSHTDRLGRQYIDEVPGRAVGVEGQDRGYPRDSDIFSPVNRESTKPFLYDEDVSEPVPPSFENKRDDELESHKQNLPHASARGVISSGLGERRASEIIPRASTDRSAVYAGEGFTPTTKNSTIENSNARESIIASRSSTTPDSYGTSTPSALVRSVLEASESKDVELTAKSRDLPRGAVFRILRKSASEVSPRKQLPPRPPRSNTHDSVSVTDKADNEYDATSNIENQSRNPRANVDKSGLTEMLSVDKGKGKEHESSTYLACGQRLANPSEASQRAIHQHGGEGGQLAIGSANTDLSKVIEQTLAQGIDAVRQDLRSDILNIHTEFVLTASRQMEQIRKLFIERDKVIEDLHSQIAELRQQQQCKR